MKRIILLPLLLACALNAAILWAAPSLQLWFAPGPSARDPWKHTPSGFPPEAFPQVPYALPAQHINLIPLLDFSEFTQAPIALNYTLRILAPDGTLYFEASNIPFLPESGPHTQWRIPRQHVQLFFKEGDPKGEYEVSATVYAGKDQAPLKATTRVLELREFEFRGDFEGILALEQWMHRYYQSPEPDRAAMAYLYLTPMPFQSSAREQRYQMHTLGTFFRSLFEHDPWLINKLNARYNQASFEVKQRILFAQANQRSVPPESPAYMDKRLLEFWLWAQQMEGIPLKPLSAGIQLDALWARFFATGRYVHVQSILGALQYAPLAQREQSILPYSESERQLVSLYQLARWSLEKNLARSALLRAYCMHALNTEDLHPAAAEPLQKLLSHYE